MIRSISSGLRPALPAHIAIWPVLAADLVGYDGIVNQGTVAMCKPLGDEQLTGANVIQLDSDMCAEMR